MANIFKTTLKKDIIADIANNNKREIRFPITKFWATRFTDEFNLDEKTFSFKDFDDLELSSPSNKESGGLTYIFKFIEILVDGDEFVIKFADHLDNSVEEIEENTTEDEQNIEIENTEIENTEIENNFVESVEDIVTENNVDVAVDDLTDADLEDNIEDTNDNVNVDPQLNTNIDMEKMLALSLEWLEEEHILDDFYNDEKVYSTNARQVVILPKGRILGSKRIMPVNNDVEIRVEFDMHKKIYLDAVDNDLYYFGDEIIRVLSEMRNNNFVFVWKRHTGIFMDNNKRIYFGIKYSTRKSIGFDRKYSVQ